MWRNDHDLRGDFSGELDAASSPRPTVPTPGKTTLTARLPAPAVRPSLRPLAEQRRIATGAFAGAPAPLPYRDEMEQAFGRSFGEVTAFRDDTASAALTGAGAAAVTLGNRVAFRDPSPGRELVAHELAHVVQYAAAGPAAAGAETYASREAEARQLATAAAAGRPVAVTAAADPDQPQFDDDGWENLAGEPLFPEASAEDMYPVQWDRLPPRPPPGDQLGPWSPRVDHQPPPAVHRSSDSNVVSCRPGFARHTRDLLHAVERRQRTSSWQAYLRATTRLSQTWQRVFPLHNQFEQLTDRQELRAVHGLLVGNGDQGLEQAVETQPAGSGDGDNSLHVADLFHTLPFLGRRMLVGTDLEISRAADRGIDRAARHVSGEVAALERTGRALGATIEEVSAATDDLDAADEGVRAALLHVDRLAATQRRDAEQEGVDRIESEIEATKRDIEDVVHVVQLIAAGVGAATAPAATARAGARARYHRAAGNVDAVAGSGAVESIANRVIDAINADRLEQQKGRLERASQRLRGLIRDEANSRLLVALSHMGAAIHRLAAARQRVAAQLVERRLAYEQLASAAARASGAPAGSRAHDEIRAAVAAIPIVDLVVVRSEAIVDAAVLPQYTPEAGQGLGMAMYNAQSSAIEFVDHAAQIRYLGNTYRDVAQVWGARKHSLQAVVDRLAGNHEGGIHGRR